MYELEPCLPGLVGGRLAHFVSEWEAITSDAFVLNIVRNGYALKFDIDGPPALSRRPISFGVPRDPLKVAGIRAAVQAMMEKNAVEVVRI